VNYSSYLELEHRMIGKLMIWLKTHAENPAEIARAIQKAVETDNMLPLNSLVAWQMHFKRDASGQTGADRWIRAAHSELSNDERTLLQSMHKMRMTLLEVRRVLDHQRTELVDLFEPDQAPMIIMDRGLAASATRFATYLGFVFPLPHYWRMSGGGIELPELGQFEPMEIVAELVCHLHGPSAVAERRLWLSEHLARFETALTATSYARRRDMISSLDAKFGKVVYELQAPFIQCRTAIDALPGQASEPPKQPEREEGFVEVRVWFDDDNAMSNLSKGSLLLLGRVLLGQSHWRLEAMGADRMARFRARFEKQMGALVKFAGERLDDMGAQMLLKEPHFDPALVPPRLLENADKVSVSTSMVRTSIPGPVDPVKIQAQAMQAQDRDFLDSIVPALEGRTPREAARDPVLRPKLIRLMKSRVRSYDGENLRSGSTLDINGLLLELGLDELILDPPPFRKTQQPNG
jgi:hypothetical protein